MKHPIILKWLVATAVLDTSEDFVIPEDVRQRWIKRMQEIADSKGDELITLDTQQIIDAIDEAIAFVSKEPAPVNMVLHCPRCGLQHIDAPEDTDSFRDLMFKHAGVVEAHPMPWTNPPHKSHLCSRCKFIWQLETRRKVWGFIPFVTAIGYELGNVITKERWPAWIPIEGKPLVAALTWYNLPGRKL